MFRTRFSNLIAFASTAFDAFADTVSLCLTPLVRITRVLAKFSPMIHAQPGVQIVRAVAHQATFMHRSLSRREANYLRTCT
jgi:hypothetical protein